MQGVRILTVALACYGWWGVIYPELTMLPSTYEIVYEETEATEAETVQTGPEVVEWNFRQPDLLEDSGGGSGADPVQEQTAYDVKKIKRRNPMYQENVTALKKGCPHRGIRFRYRRTDRCPGDHAADSQ